MIFLLKCSLVVGWFYKQRFKVFQEKKKHNVKNWWPLRSLAVTCQFLHKFAIQLWCAAHRDMRRKKISFANDFSHIDPPIFHYVPYKMSFIPIRSWWIRSWNIEIFPGKRECLHFEGRKSIALFIFYMALLIAIIWALYKLHWQHLFSRTVFIREMGWQGPCPNSRLSRLHYFRWSETRWRL